MDTRPRVTPRSYEDFQPSVEWDREERADTVRVTLPEFKKEQLKVQIDNFGNLKVSGERPLAGNRWSRFRKEFRIPQNCSTRDIRAKFENTILSVILPKLITAPHPQDQPTKAEEPVASHEATDKPKPRENQDNKSQKDSTPITPSKSDGSVRKQANGKSGESSKPADTKKNVQSMQEKEKDRTDEPVKTRKAKNDIGERDGQLSDFRKRESVTKDAIAGDDGSWPKKPKYKVEFKKHRQLMLTVGVTIMILAGLALYMTYKLRKSIKTESN